MGAEAERLLGRLVARLSLCTPVFDFQPVNVRFVLERVARGQTFLQ
jgi:hypothetical protein